LTPQDKPRLFSTSKPRRSHNGYVSSIWTFDPAEDVSYAGHSIYRWYGTLPGPLVGRLLDLYADTNGPAVWDPMCGAGTTLVEARLRGISAEGFDANPLAVLVSDLKLDAYPAAVTEVVDALHALRQRVTRESAPQAPRDFSDRSFDYARKWFNEPSLTRLLQVADAVARLDAPVRLSRLLLVALASAVRDVAEVDPRCTHHLVRKRKPYMDALPLVESRALGLAEAVSQIPLREAGGEIRALQKSYLDDPASAPSLAIVHPPYLGVIHYNLIHRLSTDILRFVQEMCAPKALDDLRFDPEVLKSVDVSTDSDARYDDFLINLTSRLEQVLPAGGRAVVIMGDARHKGLLRHPFTRVVDLMESRKFDLEENFIWILQNNGGMHVLRRGHHIDHNYILVFRRAA
jgi:DNA modification methylase